MHKLPLALLGLAAATSAALAQPIPESEPNNTAATADLLGTFNGGGSVLAEGFITPGSIAMDLPGDVDYFRITLNFPSFFMASAFGIPDSGDGDAQLALISGDGLTIIAADDDSGIDLFPSLEATLAPGTYLLAMTGFNDLSFPGPFTLPDGRNPNQSPHLEDFQYKLLVGFSVVPAPSAAALLGLGALAATRRRR
jgi:MYXO-CTERM domain-containing protein